jgi:hypothetical protein
MSDEKWVKLIGGGFAHMTAPFAVHANDEMRAKEYLSEAQAAGLTMSDTIQHARKYLESAKGWPFDMDEQLGRVRDFYTGKLPD